MNTYWIKYVAVGLGVGLGARVIQDRESQRETVKETVVPAATKPAVELEVSGADLRPSAPQGLRMTQRKSAEAPH